MRKYIIYGLIDPRNGQLRYVGKSTRGLSRPRSHCSPTHLRQERTHKANWLRQLLSQGLKPDIEVLEECGSAEALSDAEVFHIAYWRMVGADLTNLTAGGEGSLGRKLSPEVRERIANKLRGLQQSDETKAKRAAAHQGRRRSDEQRRKMSNAQRKRVNKDLQAAQAHMTWVREQRTEESFRRQATTLKQTMADPERRRQASRVRGGRPLVDENGVVYDGANDAARRLGLNPGAVSEAARMGWRTKGHRFKYADNALGAPGSREEGAGGPEGG